MMTSMIEALSDPAALPDTTEKVSVVQTHISIVFVADAFVYKIKKPVNFGFLDFSTLEKRRYYCYQELKLNRRLSKGIYLDVLPVTFDGGRFYLGGGPGETVEYAVKMKRIPEDKLMKTIFVKGGLTRSHLRRTAEVLARFHLNALRTHEIESYGKPERFRVNTDENFEQVERYCDISIPRDRFVAIRRWTDQFYREMGALFRERISQGKIRDCHGDLHMEHVCFTEQLSIIDCIEFNDRFRYGDTVADIAFLLMDLEYHGGYDHAKVLWEAYEEMAGEKELDPLLTFYKVYRAFVRGKVNSFQMDDEGISVAERDQALERARKYFQLAYAYTAEA